MLANPEARETAVDISVVFNRRLDGNQLNVDFQDEYFRFVGSRILGTSLEPAITVNSSGGEVDRVYTVLMPLVNAPRISGTEGLIAEMRFHGKS